MSIIAEWLIFDWSWLHGDVTERPFSSYNSVNIMMFIYWIVIAFGCWQMKGRKPYENTLWLTVPQNFLMCIFSFYAFIGMFSTLWRNWSAQNHSLFLIICDPQHHMMQDMDYWMYTFYLSKVCFSFLICYFLSFT